ncbi:MAG: glycosyltransferase family 4 protein [Candidatus Moranbacteria bacterium]|nr:glycosyltransferase family 4 protein [Candidatus Moranbacteria bacterium]NTW45753.1 glycosyltransferase family 4 protein [Candidatus Moranbacteria bacterium]
MRIAVQAADLDASRVDGTRVYLLELLKRFGALAPDDMFLVCHREAFNPELTPPFFPNYDIRTFPGDRMWMQTAFAKALFRLRPDRVFIPLQAVPIATPDGVEIVATVHDLAFRHFPGTFPAASRAKLNLLLGATVRKATRIIAVSEATKRDLLVSFPDLSETRIHVVHHGVNAGFFEAEPPRSERDAILSRYGLEPGSYALYVGAIQPRKNLIRLVGAFEKAKLHHPEMKLVIVGERAWLSDSIVTRMDRSPFSGDIVRTGKVPFSELPTWYRNARLFAFPSLYEGFGLPALEAMASGTPVLLGNVSSLPEVGGEAALYADPHDEDDIAGKLSLLWGDASVRDDLRAKGYERVRGFSWDRCARETLDCIIGR